jgi:hypothetical protein
VLSHFERTPDARAYPHLYATYGRTHTGNLQLEAWNLQNCRLVVSCGKEAPFLDLSSCRIINNKNLLAKT